MTVYSFLVGSGLIWFVCFLYVVHGIAQGETWRTGALESSVPEEAGLAPHLARTRVRRGR